MRYFVRYAYDADDDGLVAGEDYDDNDSGINDFDGDGVFIGIDCDDTDASIGADCDGDGLECNRRL